MWLNRKCAEAAAASALAHAHRRHPPARLGIDSNPAPTATRMLTSWAASWLRMSKLTAVDRVRAVSFLCPLSCEPLFPNTGVSARRLQRRLAKQEPMPRKALAAAAAGGSAGSERADSRSASPADKVGRAERSARVCTHWQSWTFEHATKCSHTANRLFLKIRLYWTVTVLATHPGSQRQ